MNILVTGGAGFVGSNLAVNLSTHHHVTVIDNFSNASYKNLLGFRGNALSHDITKISWEDEFEDVDCIFHQAAITDTRVQDQELMMKVNVNAFKKLLTFASKKGIKVIYASSAAVYGHGKSPMIETQELSPLNIYGFSKLMMEHIAKDFEDKITIIGLRYFNVFGPGEQHKETFASMITQLYNQMKAGKSPRIFEFGEQTRDHIYVNDVLEANKVAMEKGSSGIYNVGTGKETSFNDIILYLNQVLGTHLQPEFIKNPYDFYQHKTCADISKIQKIGFVPQFSVKEGIGDYLK